MMSLIESFEMDKIRFSIDFLLVVLFYSYILESQIRNFLLSGSKWGAGLPDFNKAKCVMLCLLENALSALKLSFDEIKINHLGMCGRIWHNF